MSAALTFPDDVARGDGTMERMAMLTVHDVAKQLRCSVARAQQIVDECERTLVTGQSYITQKTLDDLIAAHVVDPRDPVQPSVYFIASADLSCVKIGKTRGDLYARDGRHANLQRQSPHQLLLVADVDGYSMVEAFFHREFAEHRIHGEWFRANAQIDELIRRIQIEGRTVTESVCPGPLRLDQGRKPRGGGGPVAMRDPEEDGRSRNGGRWTRHRDKKP